MLVNYVAVAHVYVIFDNNLKNLNKSIMKKLLLFGALIAGSAFTANAQTVLLEDSFETYQDFAISGFGNWITIDLDQSDTYTGGTETALWANAGAPQAFIIFNPTTALVSNATSGEEVRNFDPRTGLKYAASWAAIMPGDGVGGSGDGPNNDWLVSPQVTLGASQNEVSFWVKSMSPTYDLEEFQVGVYTGTGTPSTSADFTVISTGTLTAPTTWSQITYALDAYQGQNVRIGIHCVSVDHYMFMVDDFRITTQTSAGVKDQLASQISVYPNPAKDLVTVSNNNNILVDGIQIIDVNGRTVKSVKFEGVTSAEVNISDISAGIYMMTITSDKGSVTKKIIKN
ncbi:MAG: T9SS type A sorting domain-containing protein [Flavobacterium sp.]|nr:MAG: T9SS type A sorting domain-containing protein [Flavobacterium sp.]